MVPFNIALEANNLGRVFDLFLALLLIVDLGLLLVVGDKTNSTLVIGGLLNTQHLVKFGLPFMILKGIVTENNNFSYTILHIPGYAMQMYKYEYKDKYGIIPLKTVSGITLPHKRGR